ncbi:RdgB/HAM1 family non-canonical purine NTP pyrophosphatase [Methylococcus sp. EFPC2]|uniref:RdgB/HAM1 family non-canonical purine NTP pyrophosphatase n=1 Tax=Methylococcus sp. EFPC2 TaxID=2812648 RepID=UPI001966FE19|nr:RdgB/HAM1 family non-canonical purine NTP pyrophosphatase [Methylococcus sp. EFPC2]QSA96752.1 RdgB/HAM1 family non-canonical purine NTP pyrophosphatase [Methylococcus sp. EFPC2]
MTQKIVLASNNPGKIREIQVMLGSRGIEVVSQAGFIDREAEETGLTFIENALIKARHAARCSGLPAIADDSGLEVDALGGAPGVRSARYAGDGAEDGANNEKLLYELAEVPDERRTARFRCVMVYLRHANDPSPLIGQGVWEGRIALEPSGGGGFGYDPIFFLPGLGVTSAELPPDEKNRLSHRGKALHALLSQFLPERTGRNS